MISMPGSFELLIIFAAFFLLFGATKLPSLGRALGESVRSFKRGADDEQDDEDGEKLNNEQAGKLTPIEDATKHQHKEYDEDGSHAS